MVEALRARGYAGGGALIQHALGFHRILGRVYVSAIALGACAAFWLAAMTIDGVNWGVGVAWIATTGMAFYAVKRRNIAQQR